MAKKWNCPTCGAPNIPSGELVVIGGAGLLDGPNPAKWREGKMNKNLVSHGRKWDRLSLELAALRTKKRYVVVNDEGSMLGFSGNAPELTFHAQGEPATFINAALVGQLANEVGGMAHEVTRERRRK